MMRILKTVTALLALCTVSTTVNSQTVGSVSGVVRSVEGPFIDEAVIFVIETGASAQTDVQGRFFLYLPPGTYTLDIRAEGYQSQVHSLVTVPPNLPIDLEIVMTPGSPDRQENTDYEPPFMYRHFMSTVHVWTAKDISRYPVRNPSGLALLSSPVFDHRSGRGIESELTTGLSVKGSGDQELGYSLNGFDLNDPFFGGTHFVVPRNALQQAAVFSSFFPAKYGWNSAAHMELVPRQGTRRFSAFGEASTDRLAVGLGDDSYASDVLTAGIGGPVIPNVLHYFVAAQRTSADDATPGVFGHPRVIFADTSLPNPERGFIASDENGIPSMKYGPAPFGANKLFITSVLARLNLIATPTLSFDVDYLSTRLHRNLFSDEYAFTPLHVPRLERDTRLIGLSGRWIASPVWELSGGVSYYTSEGETRDRQQIPVEELSGGHLGFFGQSTQNSYNLYRSEGRQFTSVEKDASDRLQIRGGLRTFLDENIELEGGFDYRRHTIRYYAGSFSGSGGPLVNDPNQYGYYADTTGGKWKLRNSENYVADSFGYYSSKSTDPQFNPFLDGAKKPDYTALHAQARSSTKGVNVTLGLRMDYFNTDQRVLLDLSDPTGFRDSIQLASFEDLNENGVQDWLDLNGNGLRDTNEPSERTLGGTLGVEDFAPKKRTKTEFSPRAGIGVDLAEIARGSGNPGFPNIYVWLTFGWFYQMPELERLYSGSLQIQNNSVSPGGFSVTSNPNLKLQRTVATDVGLGWESYPVYLEGTVYRRTINNMFQIVQIESRPAALTIHQGLQRTNANGFNLTLRTARWNYLSSLLSYDHKKIIGYASVDDENFMNAWLDFETAKVKNPVDHSRENQILFRLDFEIRDPKATIGPKFLDALTAVLQVNAGSGFPYTPTVVNGIALGGVPQVTAVGPINSKTGPWQVRFDFKASATFTARNLSSTVFLEIYNIFDRKNPMNVYSATGSPFTDGFLESVAGLSNLASEGAVYGAQYRSRETNNAFFQGPRRVIMGLQFSY